nr:hypothetical protein [Tanacetum cinerariifolium]
PRLPHQPFVEPPFEEEILAFLSFLGHIAVIRKLTDVNINKLHQPWRAVAAIINKCLTEKKNFSAYKDYYAVATGATPPKPKSSVWKTRSSSDTTITPPTAAVSPRLTTSKKGNQAAKASKAKSLSALSEVAMIVAQQLKLATKRSRHQTHISQASGSGADEGTGYDEEEFIYPSLSTHTKEEARDEESFDPIPKTPEDTDDEGNGEKNLGIIVGREEGHDEEEDELYRDVNINQGRGIQTTQEIEDSHVTLTLVNPDDLIAADLSEMELKKIHIKKMEGNKSIHRSNEQRNLLKAIVDAYKSDKIILDTYGDTVTLKRRRDNDADKDEEPSAGPDRGSKRRREGNEPESACAPQETATRSDGRDDDEDDEEKGNDDEQAYDEEEFIYPSLSTHTKEEARDEESFDPIPKTPEDTDDEGNGEKNLGINVGREEGHDEEEDELYRDVNINQ